MELTLIPGNPSLIRAEVAKFRRRSQLMLQAAEELRNLGDDSLLEGHAARELIKKADQMSEGIRIAVTKYDVMAGALEVYAPRLEAAQNKAHAAAVEYSEHSELARIASGKQEASAAQAVMEGIANPEEILENARRFAAKFEQEMHLAMVAGQAHAEAIVEVQVAATEAIATLAEASQIMFVGLLADLIESVWQNVSKAWVDFQRGFLVFLDAFQIIFEALLPFIAILLIFIPGIGPVLSALIFIGLSALNLAMVAMLNQEFEGKKRRTDEDLKVAAISFGVEVLTFGTAKAAKALAFMASPRKSLFLLRDINLFEGAVSNKLGRQLSDVVFQVVMPFSAAEQVKFASIQVIADTGVAPLDAVMENTVKASLGPLGNLYQASYEAGAVIGHSLSPVNV